MNADEYVKRHQEIHSFLQRGFTDLFCLQMLGEMEKSDGPFNPEVSRVLAHISEVLKSDLCLIVCKTCLDDNSDNSLTKLRSNANKYFNKRYKKKYFAEISADDKEAIRTMRNKVLAHSDYERESITILVSTMGKMLYEARDYCNDLYFPDIYENAFSFTDRELMDIQLTSRSQLAKLLKQGAYPTTDSKEDGNKNV